jgi:hypothetical protein
LNDDNTEYYSVLGTVEKTNDSTLIITDDDERLLVSNRSALNSMSDADRIIAYFTMADEAKPEGIDYVIDIYNFSEVLLKPVTVFTSEIADSVGNDPVDVADIWVSKNYLNLNFQYYGGSTGKIHYIHLIRNQGEVPTDTVELEIRHNDQNDSQSYYLRGFVSFDISSLQHAGDSVILHVKATEYNPPHFDKYFTYKF